MKRILLVVISMFLLTACTPKAYSTNLKLGNEALQNGHYQEAAEDYRQAAKKKNTDEVWELLTIAQSMADNEKALKDGDFEAAIFALSKVVNSKSSVQVVKNLQKEAKAKLSQLKKALALYNRLKEEDTKGETLLEQQQFDQAIEVFTNISETDQYIEYTPIKQLKQDGAQQLAQANDSKKSYENELAKTEAAKQQEQQKQAQEKQKQEEANQPLTHQQAEDLVRQHLNFTGRTDVYVTYDHDNEKGDYIIHVYDVVIDNPQTKQGHTDTLGWYGVNKNTKNIYDAMAN